MGYYTGKGLAWKWSEQLGWGGGIRVQKQAVKGSPAYIEARCVRDIIPQHCPQTSSFYTHLPAYEDGTDSVPKRRHINFRRRGITQKKAYNNLVTFSTLLEGPSLYKALKHKVHHRCSCMSVW